jgi:hypothetical protein
MMVPEMQMPCLNDYCYFFKTAPPISLDFNVICFGNNRIIPDTSSDILSSSVMFFIDIPY